MPNKKLRFWTGQIPDGKMILNGKIVYKIVVLQQVIRGLRALPNIQSPSPPIPQPGNLNFASLAH